jgi:hypothetical protein
MRIHGPCLIVLLAFAGVAQAAPAIDLEIATERGLQITAPHQWLQLLTGIGIQNVRIRGAQPSDAPAVTNRGTPASPRYHVLGILTAREQLQLPGGVFGRADAKRLKDYFDRLSADGDQRLTAPRSLFGLIEQDLAAVLADLSQPLEFETKGQPPRAVIDRLQTKFKLKFTIEPQAERILRAAPPVADELNPLSTGTALAILLRTSGLELRPEKPRGQPVTHRITLATGEAASAAGRGTQSVRPTPNIQAPKDNRPGKVDDFARTAWPIGWETEKSPGETAPSLFEQLNAEIDGFTLEETLAAIGPRLKLPYYLDHATLAASNIQPATVQVRIERTRTSYKRLLDRVLSQARLGNELRVDEAGSVFLWIGQ